MAFRSVGLDRVQEVASPPGTGVVTLGGAATGYRAFSAVGAGILNVGDSCAYYIEAVDGNGAPTGLWERGHGTCGNPLTTFARTVVIDGSSGAGVAVNFTTNVRIGIGPMTETTTFFPGPGGRLSLVNGSPVGDSGTAGAGTLWYMPYIHDRIVLWDGVGLRSVQIPPGLQYNFSGLTVGIGYDVFGYLTAAGVLAMEILAWTSGTARSATPPGGTWAVSTRLALPLPTTRQTRVPPAPAGNASSGTCITGYQDLHICTIPRPHGPTRLTPGGSSGGWPLRVAPWRSSEGSLKTRSLSLVCSLPASPQLAVLVQVSG
jgi:hypothetical protein